MSMQFMAGPALARGPPVAAFAAPVAPFAAPLPPPGVVPMPAATMVPQAAPAPVSFMQGGSGVFSSAPYRGGSGTFPAAPVMGGSGSFPAMPFGSFQPAFVSPPPAFVGGSPPLPTNMYSASGAPTFSRAASPGGSYVAPPAVPAVMSSAVPVVGGLSSVQMLPRGASPSRVVRTASPPPQARGFSWAPPSMGSIAFFPRSVASPRSSFAPQSLAAPVMRPTIQPTSPFPQPQAPQSLQAPPAPVSEQPGPASDSTAPAADLAQLKAKIDRYSDLNVFVEAVKPIFEKIAAGRPKLDFNLSVQFFHTTASQLLGVPMGEFDLSYPEFMRFDFEGDGGLNFKEAIKCFRRNMLEMQKKIGGITMIPVPEKTPEEAGYQVISVLAAGGQGSIALAQSKEKGPVALKLYNKNSDNAGGIEELRAEMEAMNSLEKSPHIMHCYEIFQDAENFYCVDELLTGGDLCNIRESLANAGVPLTESYFQKVFLQCIIALDYMHRHAMMHCDIKEPNIMFKTRDYAVPHVAIIDFGMAKWSSSDGLAGGTPGYRPPETNDTNVWFPRGDIFCMGVSFFQILTDMTPDDKKMKAGLFTEGAQTIEEVNHFVKTRQPPFNILQSMYPSTMAWLPSMLEKNLIDRPKAPKLLAMPWFQGTDVGADGAAPPVTLESVAISKFQNRAGVFTSLRAPQAHLQAPLRSPLFPLAGPSPGLLGAPRLIGTQAAFRFA